MMPSTSAPPTVTAGAGPDLGELLGIAVGAGALLGALDLLLQVTLPYPFANLANSSAVWALAAFALTAWARTTPARAAIAGSLLLVVAVQAYYLAANLVGLAGLSTLGSSGTVAWMIFGVLAGTVFGVAGVLVGDPRPWLSAAGLAAIVAVFLSEAAARLLPGSGSGLDDLGTTLLYVAAALAVLISSARRVDRLARAALLVVPLTVLGTIGFAIGGF